uniref:Uncharacterized protein n=1 Tax=Cacopsylla melanoneura TaxID=428564 RepID=A0A8D8URZ1_9HEMI
MCNIKVRLEETRLECGSKIIVTQGNYSRTVLLRTWCSETIIGLYRMDLRGVIRSIRLYRLDWRGVNRLIGLYRLDWCGVNRLIGLYRLDWRDVIKLIGFYRLDWRGVRRIELYCPELFHVHYGDTR